MERIVVPFATAEAGDAVAALAARPATEVIAVAVDIGQAPALNGLRDLALAAGALRCHVFDLRDTLARRFLWPALRSGALGVPGEPIVTALSAPCIAEAVADVARLEHASGVAAVAADPRQRQRLRAELRALAPSLGVVAVPGGAGTTDRNLWGRVAAVDMGTAIVDAASVASSPAAHVRVRFDQGLPVALSGVTMSPAELIESLATIARSHGAGGIAVTDGAARWLVQAPAAVALHRACMALTARVLDDRAAAFGEMVAAEYAALVRDGLWFSVLRDALEAFVARVLDGATGEVPVVFEHGRIEVQE